MPKMNVAESILIQKNSTEIFNLLNDFSNWNSWSPWNILEKEIKSNVTDGGKYYDWIGELSGSGNMKILSEIPDKELKIDLNFIKPFKSNAKITFILEEKGENTQVSWKMDSSLPFFLFFMAKMMKTYIAMDFERGLLLLKDLAETGRVKCNMEFTPKAAFESLQFIGIRSTCTKANLPITSQTNFTDLMMFFDNKEDLISREAFTMYEVFDPVKDKIVLISAIPVHSFPIDLPANFTCGKLPSMTVSKVKMTGPYYHLGNPWAAMSMRERGKRFKKNKKQNPMEIYYNHPSNTTSEELITEVIIPIL